MARATEKLITHRRKPAARGGLAVFLALALAACVTDGPRDSGGRVMSISEPKALTADQTDLNIGAWLDPRMIVKVERTIRDNRGINEEVGLRGPNNSGSGFVATQRVDDGFFSLATADAIDNAEKFKALVETRLKSSGYASQETPVKIDHKRAYKSFGYKTVATLSGNKGYCLVAQAGLRLGMLSSYTNERGSPDTVIDVVFCKAARDFLEFERLIAEVGVMKPEDAALIRGKLAGTNTVAPRGI